MISRECHERLFTSYSSEQNSRSHNFLYIIYSVEQNAHNNCEIRDGFMFVHAPLSQTPPGVEDPDLIPLQSASPSQYEPQVLQAK